MIDVTKPLQNGTAFEIQLARDDGTRLQVLDTVVRFSYTRTINNIGAFSVTLPPDFDRTLIAKDRRVYFWRRPVGGAQSLAFEGLIRKIKTTADGAGNILRTVEGYGLNYLLAGRVVAYPAGHAQADQSAVADNMLKAIVDYNLGANATTGNGRKSTQSLSATYFSVAANLTLGPTVVKAFSYRNVLDVLREIADSSRTAGTELYFEIVPANEDGASHTFEFRTYTGQPGQDRRATTTGGLTFGLEFGNLSEPQLIEDSSNEINYAYGLGQGEGAAREVDTSTDTTRTGLSLFATREGKIDARAQSTTAAVTDAADALVNSGRPLLTFTGKLLSVENYVYGKDWGWGDRVTIAFDGRQFSALIRAVTVAVDDAGNESIDALTEAYLS